MWGAGLVARQHFALPFQLVAAHALVCAGTGGKGALTLTVVGKRTRDGEAVVGVGVRGRPGEEAEHFLESWRGRIVNLPCGSGCPNGLVLVLLVVVVLFLVAGVWWMRAEARGLRSFRSGPARLLRSLISSGDDECINDATTFVSSQRDKTSYTGSASRY